MLLAINDRLKGWLGIAIIILIALPFAFFGIESYMNDSGVRYAAKVNDIEISLNEFDRVVSSQRQMMLRQYDGKLPFSDKQLREMTLDKIINQRLLESETIAEGYRISDGILALKLKQLSTVDGVFDRDRLDTLALSNGMTLPMYEYTLRNELRTQQMQAAIAGSAFVTQKEIDMLASVDEQSRDITVLTFNIDTFANDKKVTKEEVEQYYEANKQRFMVPEKVKVDYVEITTQDLSDAIDIDEEKIIKMYDDYLAAAKNREERKVRHILLSTAEDKASAQIKIESIQEELKQGADFAELAKKYSDDPGSAEKGGDLDWVALGEMVKPFEKTLFAMDKGSVSDIVETQFGYHLIRLDDIRSEAIIPLGIKRYEFEDELKKDAVSSQFYDLSERLATIAYENPSSLDAVVEDLALPVKTTEFFTRNDGKGITKNAKVRDIAYSSLVLDEGNNSDIIELDPTHVVVLRINEHIPATPMPLEEVSARIENILSAQLAHEATKEAALVARDSIAAGDAVDAQVGNGVTKDTFAKLKRTDKSKVSDPIILNEAFKLSPAADAKKAVKQVNLMTGDVALIVLDKINKPESIADEKKTLIKNELVREAAIRDFANTVYAIKERSDIDKNARILE